MSEMRTIESGILYRSFEIDRAVMDKAGDRTIDLSFSSEQPVEQYNWDIGRYLEILDHSPESVDMSRLTSSAALLLEHNRDDQIGVVENARIDPDRIGRATVRFGKSVKANEIYEDVKDGIRRLVSVGYRVTKLVAEKIEDTGLNTLRAMGWQPMEISIVSVPADISVGVGRGVRPDGNKVILESHTPHKMKSLLHTPDPTGGGGTPPAANPPAANPPATPTPTRAEDIREMLSISKRHKVMDLFESALERNLDLNQFRAEVMAATMGTNPNPGTLYCSEPRPQRGLGDILVESESYRNGIKNRQHRGISIDIPVLSARATLLTSTGVTNYDRPPGIVLIEQQPLTVAMLFSQGETTAPTIRVLKETSHTQAATAVAEEGQKPEASFDLEEVDFPVKKIAVLGRVSDEMFADFPAVRDYVNSRLVFMVQSLEDNHLLNGSGSSNQITGVINTSGIQTLVAGASQSIADAVYKAITKVRSVGFFNPDAIIMHPTDWQNLRLSKDSNGQYYGGGPFGGAYGVGGFTADGPLWGLPVVATTAIAQGTILVGAYRLGGQIFRRAPVTIDTTNSDASDFQYNRIAIRVETRLALTVYRPLAFCTVTGVPLI